MQHWGMKSPMWVVGHVSIQSIGTYPRERWVLSWCLVVSSDLPTELWITPKMGQEPHFWVLAPGPKASAHGAAEIQNALKQNRTFFPLLSAGLSFLLSLYPYDLNGLPLRLYKLKPAQVYSLFIAYTVLVILRGASSAPTVWGILCCHYSEQVREGGVYLRLITGSLPTTAARLWFLFGP